MSKSLHHWKKQLTLLGILALILILAQYDDYIVNYILETASPPVYVENATQACQKLTEYEWLSNPPSQGTSSLLFFRNGRVISSYILDYFESSFGNWYITEVNGKEAIILNSKAHGFSVPHHQAMGYL